MTTPTSALPDPTLPGRLAKRLDDILDTVPKPLLHEAAAALRSLSQERDEALRGLELSGYVELLNERTALREQVTTLLSERARQETTIHDMIDRAERAEADRDAAQEAMAVYMLDIVDLRSRLTELEGALLHLLDHDSCISYRSSCDWPKDAAIARAALSEHSGDIGKPASSGGPYNDEGIPM